KRFRMHGWSIQYISEEQNHCTAKVSKGTESYTEDYAFVDAVASGYTKDRSGGLKIGWRAGNNRTMKLRYGVLSKIIHSYIPEILDGLGDIVEVAEDYTPVVEQKEVKPV